MEPKFIVVHCAATPPNMDVGAKEIDTWHKANRWEGIGYHLVIRRSGQVEPGRPLDQSLTPGWQVRQGAHVAGHNAESVGVCMVGGLDAARKPAAEYTLAQWESLRACLQFLVRCFPSAEIVGHRDLDPGKACPCFDVGGWWAEVQKQSDCLTSGSCGK